jgi:SOS-response transcriptional repressor LexA
MGNAMIGLTRKQLECWEFVSGFDHRMGRMPTFEEIKLAFGLHSKAGVHKLMQGLTERGYLTHRPYIGYEIANANTVTYFSFNRETKQLEKQP